MLPGVLGTLSSFATSQVNDIRRSLAVLARDSTAFGLPQPHLNRTGLCDIPESSFDPNYINARDQLRLHLHSSARGKRMGGSSWTEPGSLIWLSLLYKCVLLPSCKHRGRLSSVQYFSGRRRMTAFVCWDAVAA